MRMSEPPLELSGYVQGGRSGPAARLHISRSVAFKQVRRLESCCSLPRSGCWQRSSGACEFGIGVLERREALTEGDTFGCVRPDGRTLRSRRVCCSSRRAASSVDRGHRQRVWLHRQLGGAPHFEAYARVFHPARRGKKDCSVEVSWAQVAAANHRVMHPAAEGLDHGLLEVPARGRTARDLGSASCYR